MHALPPRRRLALVPALLAALLLPAALAGTASAAVDTQSQSRNWAGYVAHAKNGESFTRINGSWTVPAVSPGSGDGSAAVWVGLGGASHTSQALEQTGTSSEVSNGQTSYYAWWEIVPAPMQKLSLPVKPGDRMSATVSVSGSTVTLTLSDLSTGQSQTKAATVAQPDTSSAEWIAEAPSLVSSDGSTQVVPLADVASVGFRGVSATAGGVSGSLSDPRWSINQVSLSNDGGGTTLDGGQFGGGGFVSAGGGAGSAASPGEISGDGSAFSVATGAGGAAGGTAYDGGGNPGYDAGSGDGAGAGDGVVVIAYGGGSSG